jgi:hypothetical protein
MTSTDSIRRAILENNTLYIQKDQGRRHVHFLSDKSSFTVSK